MKLKEAKNIHCVGIGGIGLSALAKFLSAQGKKVTGSDLKETEITAGLTEYGIAVTYGQVGSIPQGTDFIIYSEAAPFENPERTTARVLGLPEMSYAEALGAVSRDKRTIAVSGTNGKSTTTAMLGLILEAAGFDPTVIVGSRVPGFPLGNLRIGEGEWMVVEADDYHAHMLHLRPEMIVLTNIEEEHLDYFGDLGHIVRVFQSFVDSLPAEGKLIVNADDPVSVDDLEPRGKTVSYGLVEDAALCAKNITSGEGAQSFLVCRENGDDFSVRLNVPGRFNVSNALAAIAAALSLGVSEDIIIETLAGFRGIWRRFEKVGTYDDAIVISDYGHHPTSVRLTLEAAREFYPDRRLVLVFQPHQRHRTKALLNDFAEAFLGADLVILSDIYDVAGREDAETVGVSSAMLINAMGKLPKAPPVVLGKDLRNTEEMIRGNAKPNDLILIMGAGDIDHVARDLVAK
jgi:UDP-N-acetylmuramate--alanine ligase